MPTTETSIAHTPGPWKLGEFDLAAVYSPTADNGSDALIAEVSGPRWVSAEDDYIDDTLTALANARLIAAAPVLLAAAKRALDEMCHTVATRADFTDVVDQLDAAIAKAEGGK